MALLGRLPSAHVYGDVMQASEKPAHYLKSQLLDRDVPERISDSITGHTTPGIGRKYEHVEMAKKFKAVSKLPVIPLAAA